METLPIGFLGGDVGLRNLDLIRRGEPMDVNFKCEVRDELRKVMLTLEPNRWADGGTEEMPSDDEFDQVIEYIFERHLLPLMEIQNEMFSNVEPQSDESLMKAFHCSQKQNKIMEQFGIFSKNEAMKTSFAKRREKGESAMKMAAEQGSS
mmetsp:Transcript_10472/g.15548  ORF Transcript_10472/g.15548 Transcript_10472/m.15548 type:complete len:150 (-) Transcript_10472:180-629(-)